MPWLEAHCIDLEQTKAILGQLGAAAGAVRKMAYADRLPDLLAVMHCTAEEWAQLEAGDPAVPLGVFIRFQQLILQETGFLRNATDLQVFENMVTVDDRMQHAQQLWADVLQGQPNTPDDMGS